MDNEPALDVVTQLPAEENFARAKRCRLIGLLGMSIAVGAVEELFGETIGDRTIDLGMALGGILLIVSWCLIDARQRSYRIRKPLLLLIVALAVFGVPIYLILTRGIRGIWSSLLALLFLVLMVVLGEIAAEITYALM